MSLLWPAFLFLLGLIPLLIAGYLWLLRRRRKSAIRYSSLSLIRAAMPPRLGLRRHLPFALLLLALSTLVLALSRPVATIEVPLSQTTVILTIDSSRSMLQSDISPNRIVAAQQAALNFINTQQSKVQIGVVAFARFAELIHPPSKDQESLAIAVRSITTGRGTSIGSGIMEALQAISEVDSSVAPIIPDTGTQLAATPVPEGQYSPNIVVLLTDGVNYGGIDPLEAALLAVVLELQAGLDDIELQLPDHSQDRLALEGVEPVVQHLHRAFHLKLLQAFLELLLLGGVGVAQQGEMLGLEARDGRIFEDDAAAQVSPMAKSPVLGRPITSPGPASSMMMRSLPKIL
jgi:hypothetical protein